MDSNHRSIKQQIYSLSPLATRESAHNTTNIQLCKPMIGLEPITCWLQISCSANWATSAKNKWDLQGSNLWPSACKADALPAELRSQLKRPGRDSNPRPPPWQGGALTNWATRPKYHSYLLNLSKMDPQGLEPWTDRLWADCSNQLS